VATFRGIEPPLSAACLRVLEVANARLTAFGVDARAAVATEEHLRRVDDHPELLVLPPQRERVEIVALVARVGARLQLELIELFGLLGSPFVGDAVTMLRKLPGEFGWWMEGMAMFAAAARGQAQAPTTAPEANPEDVRALVVEATTALVLLNLGVTASDDPEVGGWLIAEAGAAWVRVHAGRVALAAGQPLSLRPETEAQEVLQQDHAACRTLDHLQGSEARWETFAAELQRFGERVRAGTASDVGGDLEALLRFARLEGVPPELRGVPFDVALRLKAVSDLLSGGPAVP
jgi:hypothetical protein